jgi:hypothetical protein
VAAYLHRGRDANANFRSMKQEFHMRISRLARSMMRFVIAENSVFLFEMLSGFCPITAGNDVVTYWRGKCIFAFADCWR